MSLDMKQAEARLTAYCETVLADVRRAYAVITPRTTPAEAARQGIENSKLFMFKRFQAPTIFPGEEVLLLADREGLLDGMAARFGLAASKLRGIGLSDEFIFAAGTLHETNHIRGHDGARWDRGSFQVNEVPVYALTTARVALASGLPPDHDAIRFMDDESRLTGLYAALLNYKENNPYIWVPAAVDLVRARLPRVWDAARDGFKDEFIALLDSIGAYEGLSYVTAARPFGRARTALFNRAAQTYLQSNKPEVMLSWRDAAARAEKDLTQQGHETLLQGGRDYEAFRAALILRQFSRALDGVLRYADDYYPPPKTGPAP